MEHSYSIAEMLASEHNMNQNVLKRQRIDYYLASLPAHVSIECRLITQPSAGLEADEIVML